MAPRDHVLPAPAMAWGDFTSPIGTKRRRTPVHVITSLGDSLRAKIEGGKSIKAKVRTIDAYTLDKGQESVWTDDDISTQMGTPRSSPLLDHVEELSSLPGTVNEASKPCSTDLNIDSMRKVELDKLAISMACGVQAKLQTCKFSNFKCMRLHPVHEHLRNAFLEVDADSDGKLTRPEVHAFCDDLGLSSQTASQFFTLLDGHTTGFVNWEAFLSKYALLFNRKTLSSDAPRRVY